MTDTTIYGPSDESREQLRSEFAMSSRDWSQRAEKARLAGDYEAARVFACVARVADDVARGGRA